MEVDDIVEAVDHDDVPRMSKASDILGNHSEQRRRFTNHHGESLSIGSSFALVNSRIIVQSRLVVNDVRSRRLDESSQPLPRHQVQPLFRVY